MVFCRKPKGGQHEFHIDRKPIFDWVAAYRKKGRYTISTIQETDKHGTSAVMYRRIGSTTYKVRVHFDENAKDTLHDKILHLIQNETVTSGAACGIMDLPQTSRPQIRSSV